MQRPRLHDPLAALARPLCVLAGLLGLAQGQAQPCGQQLRLAVPRLQVKVARDGAQGRGVAAGGEPATVG